MKSVLKVFGLIVVLICLSGYAYAEEGDYIVKFKDGFLPENNYKRVISRENGVYLFEKEKEFSQYSEFIEYVSIDEIVQIIRDDSISLLSVRDEYYPDQWNVKLVEAESAWNIGTYGNDIKVAVIDSGCYPHDELKDNLLEGKSYVPTEPGTFDKNGHGTHVCGIIGAKQDEIGVTGVAPKVKIVPLKAFDADGQSAYSYLVDAIFGAVDDYDCKIINMSWRIISSNSAIYDAIKYAYSKGVILIAAAGNDGNTAIVYPAGYDETIAVASVESDKKRSSFSQYNSSVTIAAPGGYVKSTYNDNGYFMMKGTSQAAPVVAAAAAIALSAKTDMTPAEFKQIMIESAEDLGKEGYDVEYGYGLINIADMMDKIMENNDYYISPVNTKGNLRYIHFKNNSGKSVNIGEITANYDGKLLKKVDVLTKEVESGTGKDIELTAAGDKKFIWDMNRLCPLIKIN